MALKLHTFAGQWHAFKPLIAAQYNGVSIEVVTLKDGDTTKADFLALNPAGKSPVLETPKGAIAESNAIGRYVARMRRDTGLYGADFFESGLIDSWVDFSAHELEIPANMWVYPVLGLMPFHASVTEKAKEDLKKALAVLEKYLLLNTYLVGHSVTYADIAVASALVYPMKMVMDKEFRKPFPCVTRWFTTVVNQPEFKAVVGDVPLCNKMMKAAGDKSSAKPAKKAEPKKEQKKEKKQEEAPAQPAKKKEHPLATLNKEKPSKMVMDAWKVAYSNTKPLRKSMDAFWAMLDKEGYSVWFSEYNYNEENTVLFKTSNLVGGFMQRCDAMRKFAFGVMNVLGTPGKYEVKGCWLFRGDTIEHMLEANPDAEYHTWTRVTNEQLDDPVYQEKIGDFWCNMEELEGLPIADSKVFK